MALIDRKNKVIHCKVVYYGPGMAGKTSNLLYLHRQTPEADRSEFHWIATQTARAIVFDLRHPVLRELGGFLFRWHVYTVPGAVLYERTRIAALWGADGVVFVAGSLKHFREENIKHLRRLAIGLAAQEKSILTFPIVLQYNRRDIPGALPVEQMDHDLNPLSWQRFLTVATKGQGVMETFDAMCRRVYTSLIHPMPPLPRPTEESRSLSGELAEQARWCRQQMLEEQAPSPAWLGKVNWLCKG
jgi:signal recognition particle receptor subunit beta